MRQRRMNAPTRVTRGSRFGRPLRRAGGLGVGAHRAELDDREAAAALAHPHLAVEDGAWRVELDRQRDEQHQRCRDERGERRRRRCRRCGAPASLQPAVQRERLDEPGGVDLLHRDAAEGALVEVAQLEQGRRAIADAEQVLEQRQAVTAGGQDDRVDVVPPEDLGQLGELAHDRHDRVREIADEADQLDAARLRASRRRGRAWRPLRPRPGPARATGARSSACDAGARPSRRPRGSRTGRRRRAGEDRRPCAARTRQRGRMP